jgi:RNA polymerase-binding transcription factor DksA
MVNYFVRSDPTDAAAAASDEGRSYKDDLERTGKDVAAVDALLDSVEHALARLDQGSYGSCDSCGQIIDDAELALAPTRLTCESCSSGSLPKAPEAADARRNADWSDPTARSAEFDR